MNPYGIKKTTSGQAKKYEQLLNINPPTTERPTKGRKDRKSPLSAINSEFLEKVFQIKNSKMTPTLQITSDRTNSGPGNATTTGFYTKPINAPTNGSISYSPRNYPSGHFLTSSFVKNSPQQDEMQSPYKTQVITSPELAGEQQSIISHTSERRKNIIPTSPSDGPANRSLPLALKPHGTRIMNVSDVYENLGDMTNEIKNIIEQKYDEQIQSHIANNNYRQMLDLQSLRIQNLALILDRKGTGIQNSMGFRIQEDLNKVMKLELVKIANVYENAIVQCLERTTRIKSIREKTVKAEMDISGALRALVEYSNFHRVDGITKEGFDKGQKMYEISEEINEFKIRTKLKKNYDTKLIEVFEELESLMKDLLGSIDRHKFNYDKVVEENRILLENSRSEIHKFREDNLELIKKHFERKKSDATTLDSPLPVFKEKYYQSKVADLDFKVKDLQEKVKTYEEKYKKVKSELAVFQQNPDSQRAKTRDFGVGVNLYSEKRDNQKALSLTDIVNIRGPINGGLQSNTWVHNAVTLIYSDKLISDLSDDYDKRPRKTLKEFLIQWFVKRFGVFSVCETLLRDLIYNVRKGSTESHRLKLFCLLCGIDDGIVKEGDLNPKKPLDDIERKSTSLRFLKEAYYQSIEAQWLYFKLCLFIKQNSNPPEMYGPFLPSTLFEGSDLVAVEVARQAMVQMAADEKFEPDRIRKLEEKFDEKLGNDLYARVEDERLEHLGGTKDRMEGEHRYVRIDIILHLFMDQLMEARAQELDQFVTSMKLNQLNTVDYNLTFDEFQSCCAVRFPKVEDSKSQAWQEHAFTELLSDANADKIYFEKLIFRLIPAITNQHYTKPFDLKSPIMSTAQAWAAKEQGAVKDKKGGLIGTKEVKLITLNITSRFNTKFQGKSATSFVPGTLLSTAIFYYDYVSSMLMLMDSYELFRDKIEAIKDSSEQLDLLHDEFKEDIQRFPQGLQTMTKFEVFQQYSMGDLALYIEGCWKKFRIILGMCSRLGLPATR